MLLKTPTIFLHASLHIRLRFQGFLQTVNGSNLLKIKHLNFNLTKFLNCCCWLNLIYTEISNGNSSSMNKNYAENKSFRITKWQRKSKFCIITSIIFVDFELCNLKLWLSNFNHRCLCKVGFKKFMLLFCVFRTWKL